MLQTPVLHSGSLRSSGEKHYDRSYVDPLQFCLLCQPRAWKQVCKTNPRAKIHLLIDNASNNFRPDGVGSVTHEEKEKFQEVKERLRILLENQITNFR